MVRDLSNGGNVTRGVRPSGVSVKATPAIYDEANVMAMPPAKSPGMAPSPLALNPCGAAAAPPNSAAESAAAATGAGSGPGGADVGTANLKEMVNTYNDFFY